MLTSACHREGHTGRMPGANAGHLCYHRTVKAHSVKVNSASDAVVSVCEASAAVRAAHERMTPADTVMQRCANTVDVCCHILHSITATVCQASAEHLQQQM
jgi:hypothetical protein